MEFYVGETIKNNINDAYGIIMSKVPDTTYGHFYDVNFDDIGLIYGLNEPHLSCNYTKQPLPQGIQNKGWSTEISGKFTEPKPKTNEDLYHTCEMKRYTGFNEAYSYCSICDKKIYDPK